MNEKDAEQQRELDESFTKMIDHLPRLWYGLYTRLIEEGLSEFQALTIVQAFILKDCPAGVHIHK